MFFILNHGANIAFIRCIFLFHILETIFLIMKYNSPINIFLLVIISLLMIGVLLPAKAFCRLSAEAELDYINYDVRDNTNQHI